MTTAKGLTPELEKALEGVTLRCDRCGEDYMVVNTIELRDNRKWCSYCVIDQMMRNGMWRLEG